uniref:Uncharacterized protein n=1 Tax=Chromera velia CCMP2878 TaxID=1169474 RepID=A0A0G4FEX7_9ALVE|mmetsp:Transcript_32274/g.64068  ORF Transcript_32274/g.64068 Transcript_32274/m.64068 type:complete len:264 (+) Transcript_32274:100-891(+)|eukprot:Cvel_16640.t1-p1 / transcript=Cvel_16640.t1 / gene=Cvel_16640 / organism=Chromera_velia_CCMP2878 / gene_product=hypothetical protein / transcript_product=hypothetical protein / location=Cvel_scaffold1290:22259-23287(-) / protein_length=263 / sequence_SO=supercontig / SO=protein_coding / is_pseudo=false
MKFLSLAFLPMVAHSVIDKFGNLGDIGKFDLGGLDLLGGGKKVGSLKTPWSRGGALPKKGPFSASVPICLFVDEYTNTTVVEVDGISVDLVCQRVEDGGGVESTASFLTFNVDRDSDISVATEFNTNFQPPIDSFTLCDREMGGLSEDFYTFTTGMPADDLERQMPYECLLLSELDDELSTRPETSASEWMLVKFENGISINFSSASVGLFASNTIELSKGFKSLCGVWGTFDIIVPEGVPFSIAGYDDGKKNMKERYYTPEE